jgi:hypothetical protein
MTPGVPVLCPLDNPIKFKLPVAVATTLLPDSNTLMINAAPACLAVPISIRAQKKPRQNRIQRSSQGLGSTVINRA